MPFGFGGLNGRATQQQLSNGSTIIILEVQTTFIIEYLVYYRKEFPNYDTFLEQKYNLFPDEIKEKKSLLLCHKFLRFEADGHVSDLLEDKNIRAAFLKYIGVFSDDY